ncbi:MAG: hypothetical protein JEZ07_19510 [Phycisphaerae bacterium]|nr:hypothetical protein [Phycisphaerae bacterium]
MHIFDWVVIAIYFLLMMVIVPIVRKAKTMHEFAVGSKQIPGSILFATLSATCIGPGYSMGLANKAADKGYVWLLIFFFFSLQTILIGCFVAPKLRQFRNAYTLSDIMGIRYGKLVKLISGIFSVALCAGFVGVIAKASGDIISSITGISFIWAVIISMVFVIVYSMFGGIKIVILTDVIQFIVLAIAIPLILILMIYKNGMLGTLSNIPVKSMALSGHFTLPALAGLCLSFFLGETLIPPYANRALMARNSNDAKKGFVLSGIFSLAWFLVCASIGVFGKSTISASNDDIFLISMHQYLPVGLLGLVTAAIISIIMSSRACCTMFSNPTVLGPMAV